MSGSDGYAAALSEGEIDPKLEGKQMILAYHERRLRLSTALVLSFPAMRMPSRGVHDVVTIEVK